ncbi:MAG: cytochrome c biogenesis protein CcsA, partial [Prolixibacteraceae bacterium]|nr:cytochrome c biogenesis protein CcsA [Prolixibacteraceae bacterium]
MKKILKALSSPIFMVFLLVLLIVAMAAATFIENDYGSTVARLKVYNAFWFELILVLLSVNFLAQIVQFKLYKPAKLSIFLFHFAFIIMIIGAGITRYFGEEGTMHIREGEVSNIIDVNERVFKINVEKNGQKGSFVFNSALELKRVLNEKFMFEGENYSVKLSKYYETVSKQAVRDETGSPVLGFMVSGQGYRGFDYLLFGETKKYGTIDISFGEESEFKSGICIYFENDMLLLKADDRVVVSQMGGEAENVDRAVPIPVEPQMVYNYRNLNFVMQDMLPKAKIIPSVPDVETMGQGMSAMVIQLSKNEQTSELVLFEDEWNNGKFKTVEIDQAKILVAYGNRTIELPFSLYLNDFVIERYPGSNSPSSFSSYVTIHEKNEEPMPYHIFMNNILKHQGYRFFQSSYDTDELGTILSVNHDPVGTAVTYFGYLLMLIGIVWSMINPKSFFRRTLINKKLLPIYIAFFLMVPGTLSAQQSESIPQTVVDKSHAEKFGHLFVQNYKGRTEPMFTYASELLRKIARAESFNGLSPTQVYIEMSIDPASWMDVPLIKISNNELQRFLGLRGKYAAYNDLVIENRGYVLSELVSRVYAKPAAQRDKFDKAVIKTDEKVNICFGIFTGNLLKVLPVPGNPEPTKWFSANDAPKLAQNKTDSLMLGSIVAAYFSELINAKISGNYKNADAYLEALFKYQSQNAGYNLPSEFKTKVEIFYQKLNAFKKLFPFYFAFGLLFLFLLIAFIVIGKQLPKWLYHFFYFSVLMGFIVHTVGLAARWYISGHAPMSNGYESMVFISWVTILSGFIFNKRSQFVLTATAVLAGLTLMVANLSFMDPEVSNLVPVLQSYWLTIHVSVITASYGFLGLGALLGTIVQILFVFANNQNKMRIAETINNITVINHKTLIVGLYLLTIGTFLGAVWANESWGRYWGWDPKETWALISMLVYAIVIHARMVPGMKGVFAFN